MIGAGLFFAAPFAWMISVAGQDPGGVFARPFRWIPDHYRWENFSAVTSLLPFGRYALNTLVIGQPRNIGPVQYILNNSFGMLGINSAVVVRRFTG